MKDVDLLVVWGGDGMVQRSIDTLAGAGTKIPLAIIPAGTGNLLATNLGVPHRPRQAPSTSRSTASAAGSTWAGSTASTSR